MRRWWPAALAVAQAATMFAASSIHYGNWNAAFMDLGLFARALWQIGHGRLAALGLGGSPILADHFSLLLYPLALPFRFLGGVYLLFALQAACMSFVSLAGFVLARRHLPPWLAAVAYGAFLLYPWTYFSTLYDFHPDCLGAAALAAVLLEIDADRWVGAYVWAAVAALAKDYVGGLVCALGLGLLVTRAVDARRAAALAAGGALWSAFVYLVGMAAVARGGVSDARLLPHLGFGLFIATAQQWPFGLKMLAPLAFLPLLSPWGWPGVGLVLFGMAAPAPAMHSLYFHYALLPAPFLFAGTADGLRRLSRVPRAAWGAVASGAAAVFLITARGPYRTLLGGTQAWAVPQLQAAARLIPADAPLYAPNVTLGHLGARQAVMPEVFASTIARSSAPTYFLLTDDRLPHNLSPEAQAAFARAVRSLPDVKVLLQERDVALLRVPEVARTTPA